MNTAKGFTLIEIMIAVAILGILAAISISLLGSYRMKSYNVSSLSDTRNLMGFSDLFYNEYGEYAPVGFSDMTSTGKILVNVTLQDGNIVEFKLNALNKDTRLMVKTSGNNGFAIVAGKSLAGDTLYANDMDKMGIKKQYKQAGYLASDLPAPSAANDLLIGWAPL